MQHTSPDGLQKTIECSRQGSCLDFNPVAKGLFFAAHSYRPVRLRSTSSRTWVICSLRWHLLSGYKRGGLVTASQQPADAAWKRQALCTGRWVAESRPGHTWRHVFPKGCASCLMNQSGPEQRLSLARLPSVTSNKRLQGDYKLLLKIWLQILVGETGSFHSAAVTCTEKSLTVDSDLWQYSYQKDTQGCVQVQQLSWELHWLPWDRRARPLTLERWAWERHKR